MRVAAITAATSVGVALLASGCGGSSKEASVCSDFQTRPQLFDQVIHHDGHIPSGYANAIQTRAVPSSVLVNRLGRLPDEVIEAISADPNNVINAPYGWWRWRNTAYFVAEYSANSLEHQYVLATTCDWKRTVATDYRFFVRGP